MIYHNETCIHANDQSSHVWVHEDRAKPIHDKSRGRIVHVSDFILECCGRLVLSDAEIAEQMKLPISPLPLVPLSTSAPAKNAVSSNNGPTAGENATLSKVSGEGLKGKSQVQAWQEKLQPPPRLRGKRSRSPMQCQQTEPMSKQITGPLSLPLLLSLLTDFEHLMLERLFTLDRIMTCGGICHNLSPRSAPRQNGKGSTRELT